MLSKERIEGEEVLYFLYGKLSLVLAEVIIYLSIFNSIRVTIKASEVQTIGVHFIKIANHIFDSFLKDRHLHPETVRLERRIMAIQDYSWT